jgi:hypothetical protein
MRHNCLYGRTEIVGEFDAALKITSRGSGSSIRSVADRLVGRGKAREPGGASGTDEVNGVGSLTWSCDPISRTPLGGAAFLFGAVAQNKRILDRD